MSELSGLRAEYKDLAGKNASPGWKADVLQAKIAELKAAAAASPPAQEPPAQEPPAQEPPAQEPPAQEPPAEDPPAEDAAASDADAPQAPEQPVEEACAELGLSIDNEGHCDVEMIDSVAGGLNLKRGDPHRFEAAEAVRAVRAGIARPRG